MQELTETVAEALAERTADMPVVIFSLFPSKTAKLFESNICVFLDCFFSRRFFQSSFFPCVRGRIDVSRVYSP